MLVHSPVSCISQCRIVLIWVDAIPNLHKVLCVLELQLMESESSCFSDYSDYIIESTFAL